MNSKVFRALMRKDFRLYRGPVVSVLVSSCIVYLMGVMARITSDHGGPTFTGTLEGSGVLAMGVTMVLGTTFGGMAFAAERRERTADFLNLLPPGRGASVVSKLLVAASVLAGFFALHFWLWLVGIQAIYDYWPDYKRNMSGMLQLDSFYAVLLATGLIMGFGMSWLLSSFMRSAAISACIGGGCALIAFIALNYVRDARWWSDEHFTLWWVGIALVCGTAGVVAGATVYVRRVEP